MCHATLKETMSELARVLPRRMLADLHTIVLRHSAAQVNNAWKPNPTTGHFGNHCYAMGTVEFRPRNSHEGAATLGLHILAFRPHSLLHGLACKPLSVTSLCIVLLPSILHLPQSVYSPIRPLLCPPLLLFCDCQYFEIFYPCLYSLSGLPKYALLRLQLIVPP